MTEPSGYALESLLEGADFTLYRRRQNGNPSSILAVAPATEQPSPRLLRRFEHKYPLAAELDSAWAAKLLDLTWNEGRITLILADPGSEPLDRVLERQPLDLTRFTRIEIGLTAALGQVHRHGLCIRKSSLQMCSSTTPGRYGSPDLRLRPSCCGSASCPFCPRLLLASSPIWRPSRAG
jgi:hypothetical protein